MVQTSWIGYDYGSCCVWYVKEHHKKSHTIKFSMNLTTCVLLGMHYTAMAGTEYKLPPNQIPPTPALSRAGLIGIISAIVVVACVLLLYIAVKSGVAHLPIATQAKKSERLFLDVVFFDKNGRILVNLDGVVPMKEVLGDIHANVS